MSAQSKQRFVIFIRNFIFGAEDSLVSTVGLLSGVAVANLPRFEILLTGVVLIFVEAFSMAVGSFLSEYSAEEYTQHSHVRPGGSLAGGAVMFVSYLVSGLVPLWPYLVFDADQAFGASIVSALIGLLVLGIVSAKVLKISLIKNGLRMLIIGGLAVGVGVLIGSLVNQYRF